MNGTARLAVAGGLAALALAGCSSATTPATSAPTGAAAPSAAPATTPPETGGEAKEYTDPQLAKLLGTAKVGGKAVDVMAGDSLTAAKDAMKQVEEASRNATFDPEVCKEVSLANFEQFGNFKALAMGGADSTIVQVRSYASVEDAEKALNSQRDVAERCPQADVEMEVSGQKVKATSTNSLFDVSIPKAEGSLGITAHTTQGVTSQAMARVGNVLVATVQVVTSGEPDTGELAKATDAVAGVVAEDLKG